MKPLQEKFEGLYCKQVKISGAKTAKTIIKNIEKETEPDCFKQQFLSCVQLYFDGLINSEYNPENRKIQQNTLEMLCKNGAEYIGKFYRGEGEDTKEIKQNLLSHSDKIINICGEELSGGYHLSNKEESIHKTGLKITKFIQNIDTIVPVASEGFETAFLIANILETEKIFPLRYSHWTRGDSRVMIPKNMPDSYAKSILENKNVLVVEGHWVTGRSMINVINYVKNNLPNSVQGVAVIAEESIKYEIFKVLSEKNPTIFYAKLKPLFKNF